MVRIAIHDPRLPSIAGGAEAFEMQIALQLYNSGYEVHIVTSEAQVSSGLYQEFAEQFPSKWIHRFSVARCPPLAPQSKALHDSDRLAPLALAFGSRVSDFYCGQGFDAVITTFLPDLHFLPADENYIFHVFGAPTAEQAQLEEMDIRKIKTILPVSDFVSREFISLFPCAASIPGKIIAPWISSEFFVSAEVRERDIDICYIGRLKQRKGVRELLLAVAELHETSGAPLRTVIVGDGDADYVRVLRQVSRERGISHLVSFEGAHCREEVVGYLDKAKLFVYPVLLPEAFALAPLEAMARGAAVISTNLGGTQSYMNESNFLPCAAGDATSLANAIEYLLNHKDRRLSLARAGAATAAGYSLNERWPMMEKMYLTAIYDSARTHRGL